MNKELLGLINEFKSELKSKYLKFHNDINGTYIMHKKKTRKRVIYDIEKTMTKLVKLIGKYSVLTHAMISGSEGHEAIRTFSITVQDDSFKIMNTMVSLTNNLVQPFGTIDCVVTNMVITNHAVMRWLERNDSKDITAALFNLGESIITCDQTLGILSIHHKKSVYGYTEKQMKTKDGGIAFIIMKNPEENNYRKMEWYLTTYISKSMIQNWNEIAVAKEFDNIRDTDSQIPVNILLH